MLLFQRMALSKWMPATRSARAAVSTLEPLAGFVYQRHHIAPAVDLAHFQVATATPLPRQSLRQPGRLVLCVECPAGRRGALTTWCGPAGGRRQVRHQGTIRRGVPNTRTSPCFRSTHPARPELFRSIGPEPLANPPRAVLRCRFRAGNRWLVSSANQSSANSSTCWAAEPDDIASTLSVLQPGIFQFLSLCQVGFCDLAREVAHA